MGRKQLREEAGAEPWGIAPMSREQAEAAALELFRQMDDMLITGPGGKASWLAMSERGMNLVPAKPVFCRGTAGMGAFFAAVHALGGETAGRAAELADICLQQPETAARLLEEAAYIPENALQTGMSDGLAGVVRALDIMERGLGSGRADELKRRLLAQLRKVDIENAHCLDVYSGAAGLLLELCRAHDATVSEQVLLNIRRTAERLLGGRTLKYKGQLLWDPLDKKRPRSGAGPGKACTAAVRYGAARAPDAPRCPT